MISPLLSILLLLLTHEHASACADDDDGLRAGVQANFPQYSAYVTNCAALPTLPLLGNGCINTQTKAVAEQYCPVTCNTCPPSGAAPSPSRSTASSFWCSSLPASGVHIVQSSTSSAVDNSCVLTDFVVTVEISTSLELSSDTPGTKAVISGTRTLLFGLLPQGTRLFFLRENSNLTLTDLILEKGTDKESGGCIYALEFTRIRMTRTVVRDCQAQYGGGLFLGQGSVLILEDTIFELNVAVNGGGAIFMSGATMDIVVGSSATFASNKVVGLPPIPPLLQFAAPKDGNIYLGGALYMETASSIKVTGAGTKLIVHSNAAGNFLGDQDQGWGGGLYVRGESTVSVDAGAQLNCTGNQAIEYGGCMALLNPETRLDVHDATSSLIISKNQVLLPLESAGGGIYLTNSAVMHVTAPSKFEENKAEFGSGGALATSPLTGGCVKIKLKIQGLTEFVWENN